MATTSRERVTGPAPRRSTSSRTSRSTRSLIALKAGSEVNSFQVRCARGIATGTSAFTRPGRRDSDAAAVAEEHRLLHVVGDEQDRLARGLGDGVQLLLQRDAGLGVDGRERLVHQHDVGVRGQRAGHRHPLAHAARQLVRVLLLEALQPDQVDEVAHGGRALGLRHALDLQAMGDVLLDRAPRQDGELLEDDAAVAAGPGHRPAVDEHAAAGGGDETGQDAQQRGLAAPARPHHGDELAVGDVELDVRRARPRARA